MIPALAIVLGMCFFPSCSISLREVSRETDSGVSETKKPDKDDKHSYILPKKIIEYEGEMSKTKLVEEADMWVKRYNMTYGEGKADEIILTPEQIAELNGRIIKSSPTVTDMTLPPEKIPGKDVIAMMKKYALPAGDKFNKRGERITPEEKSRIINNAAMDLVGEEVEVRLGIVTDLCDLRGFPTTLDFYSAEDPNHYYSAIQETELVTGFPVFILHESRDGEFLFVQSYYYAGWVEKSKTAECDRNPTSRSPIP